MRSLSVLVIYDAKYGTRTHVLTLAKELRALGHNVITTVAPFVAVEVVTFGSLVTLAKQLLMRSFGMIGLLRRTREHQVDVIHVHNTRVSLVVGYLLHKLCGIPLVVTIHEGRPSISLRVNRLYTKADRIIAISPEVSESVVRLGATRDRVVVIPNMIETERYDAHLANDDAPNPDVNPRNPKLVSAGRIDESKFGLTKTIMKSMSMIVRAFPDAQLLVVGDGPYLSQASEMARGVNDQLGRTAVVILGYVEDIVQVMSCADVVVGVGRVAMEGMACGKPVIVGSTDKSGVVTGGLVTKETAEEFKRCNFSGRHYPETLDCVSFSELVTRLMTDEDYRRGLGEWGRDFVRENLEARAAAERVEVVYLECLKRRLNNAPIARQY